MTGTMDAFGPFAPLTAIVLGLCLGSFLNVVIHRVPRGESVVFGRSRCPRCGAAVRVRDNVPLLGWLLLCGRCRDCGGSISPRYPLVEAASALLALLVTLVADSPAQAVAGGVLALSLLAVMLIDLDHQIIPDVISVPGIVLGFAAAPWLGTGRLDSLLGALAGAGFFLAVHYLYRAVRGETGLGGGDIKLAAMLGAWLGVSGVLLTILFGSFLGAAFGLALMSRGRAGSRTRLPYGAFLAPAAIFVLFCGGPVWTWYLNLSAI